MMFLAWESLLGNLHRLGIKSNYSHNTHTDGSGALSRPTWIMRLILATIFGKDSNRTVCDIADTSFITFFEVLRISKIWFLFEIYSVEGNTDPNSNHLIRTSWEGIQLVARTRVADITTEFGSQLRKRNKTCVKWHKSAKREKKSIYIRCELCHKGPWLQHIHSVTVSQHVTVCVCVSRSDRCHTVLMQTGIRWASDLVPRPWCSPLNSSHPRQSA